MCPMRALSHFILIFSENRFFAGGLRSLLSNKSKVILILAVLFAFMVFDAFAAGLSGRAVVALGSVKLSIPSGSEPQMVNNSSINVSSINNISINNSTANNSSMGNLSLNNLSAKNKLIDKPARIVPVMDLSRYAKDRLNKSLTGYKNIMYPLAETRGSTASTGGSGGGSGGGCGCG
jgi:hypothetical protein